MGHNKHNTVLMRTISLYNKNDIHVITDLILYTDQLE